MKYKSLAFFLICLIYCNLGYTQKNWKFKIVDQETQTPLAFVSVSINDIPNSLTDSAGLVALQLQEGMKLSFSIINYEPVNFVVKDLLFKDVIQIEMQQDRKIVDKIMEGVTIISSTRTNQKIETAPIKVEVLDAEEMNEESGVKPATITGIIGDISGVQIQQISAVSGNSDVRIQGLEGRYTQILRDGLPLYDGFSGGFGIMSIPPLDLKQIELIKGSSSTLYGGGAIGGLVNLISKKPTTQQEAIATINQTTLKETNFNSFFSKRNNTLGYTLYAGATHQNAVDVNNDLFSDVAKLRSFVLHPRLFFYPNKKSAIILGYTYTQEQRKGGDMQVIEKGTDSIHQFFEKNDIVRNSVELLIDKNITPQKKWQFKSSFSHFNRTIAGADNYLKAAQLDYFSEFSYVQNGHTNSWVMGTNFTGNHFKKLGGDPLYFNQFQNQTIGAFTQFSQKLKGKSSVELGLRNDYHRTYGDFILPRVAVFHQINEHWGMRAGYGAGYKVPNPLSVQLIDYPIQNILPLSDAVKAEKSNGYNWELNYKIQWNKESSLFINHAFFLTRIQQPIIATEPANGLVYFFNAAKPIVSKGFDTYMKLSVEDWSWYAGITYTIAERKYLDSNQFMPLTPKLRMAGMLTREWEGKARFCVEMSYNGYQYRLDYSKTPGYLFMAAMVEYNVTKHLSVVANVENLLDYRQSKSESLYTGNTTAPTFVPLWAPIDGRVFNFCLKYKL